MYTAYVFSIPMRVKNITKKFVCPVPALNPDGLQKFRSSGNIRRSTYFYFHLATFHFHFHMNTILKYRAKSLYQQLFGLY